ncbi:peptidylprolyl isomerase [Synechococcus sp. A15-24]|uniref:peptidylprolyl isomerase n=1 Tax=Synechococcus sp. A15-24 TaxID=1050635 RepID=UPI0016461BFA|nr:peptidylprolyl isomerase [Synechococcus sp. A15-24]QNJ27857.1 hypothetical protein SynA1524_00138 [Synechococcus sp. A15-24]
MNDFPFDDRTWHLLVRSSRTRILIESWIEEQICKSVSLEKDVESSLVASFASSKWMDEADDVSYAATRMARLQRFKRSRFLPKVEEYFTRTRSARDQLIFSMLRCRNSSRLQELALAIREGELELSAAAIRWSEGPESARGGRIGPVLASNVGHPELTKRLLVAVEGRLIGPFDLGDTNVLIRLDKRLPARLTHDMEGQLIDELYQEWISAQIGLVEEGGTIDLIEYLPD